MIDPDENGETSERISFVSHTESNARTRAMDWGSTWSKEHPDRDVYMVNTANQFIWEIRKGEVIALGDPRKKNKKDKKDKK